MIFKPRFLPQSIASGLIKPQSDTVSVTNLGKCFTRVLMDTPVIAAPVRLRVRKFFIEDNTKILLVCSLQYTGEGNHTANVVHEFVGYTAVLIVEIVKCKLFQAGQSFI